LPFLTKKRIQGSEALKELTTEGIQALYWERKCCHPLREKERLKVTDLLARQKPPRKPQEKTRENCKGLAKGGQCHQINESERSRKRENAFQENSKAGSPLFILEDGRKKGKGGLSQWQ